MGKGAWIVSLVLCHAPACVCLNVYWDSIETSVHLLQLQDFGSDGRGGRLSYELTVAPSKCSWNPAADGQACEWNSLDTVYATLLTENQWVNLTQRLGEIDTLGRISCMQPSAVRAQLSFEHWQDAQAIAGVVCRGMHEVTHHIGVGICGCKLARDGFVVEAACRCPSGGGLRSVGDVTVCGVERRM